MRAGEPAAAATSFDVACKKAIHRAIGEDACFWAGVAARRAGEAGRARRYLSRFLRRYPKSSRAGEASALLGWILSDDGRFDDARRRFRAAASDRVPKVRRSAQTGLDAIDARRESD
jgi:TolA-binding protein